jgi:hypothetical protein
MARIIALAICYEHAADVSGSGSVPRRDELTILGLALCGDGLVMLAADDFEPALLPCLELPAAGRFHREDVDWTGVVWCG